ncbi:hypothetical protein RF11_10974 [Thelohanellus kitauei]|uniref:Uncharacterized protein n=1 Tax=Thelohanellus kitauei TaxID=669202 RepID=A0A0C2IBE7_THEKT|nr:hypothetical protein RF11_10974 [Thelohanellus kitauei]
MGPINNFLNIFAQRENSIHYLVGTFGEWVIDAVKRTEERRLFLVEVSDRTEEIFFGIINTHFQENTNVPELSGNSDGRRTYKTISNECRQHIIDAISHNDSLTAVSRMFDVDLFTIHRIWKEYQLSGKIDKAPKGGNRAKSLNSSQEIFCATPSKMVTLSL